MPLINEFQREFGVLLINLDMAEGDKFLGELLDSEPNRLRADFRQMLFQQTSGNPLFTIELIRGMQERAKNAGGTLSIDSQPLSGTTVCFVVEVSHDPGFDL